MGNSLYTHISREFRHSMIFKLDRGKRESGSTERSDDRKLSQVDQLLLEKMAKAHAADKKAIEEARERLSGAFQDFLGQLDRIYKTKEAEQLARTEANYEVWASFYELLKQNFKELWAFFGVVQSDVQGWHRTSPSGSPLGYVNITKEGYSFTAGLEQNEKKGAPFPKKWLTVTVAHATGYLSGIGDERLLGRTGSIDENLVGIARCTAIKGDKQEQASKLLKARIEDLPIIFTLSNETKGQHTTRVPTSTLQKFSLAEMCQPLIVALTNDDMGRATKLLPTEQQLRLLGDGK